MSSPAALRFGLAARTESGVSTFVDNRALIEWMAG
jgi:hypothetical protein